MAEEMVAGHSGEEESSAENDNSMSEDPSAVEDSVSEESGAPTANRECWQFDPRYAKYWQHWHSMMGWYQRHRRAPAQVRAVWQHVMQN
ncbi:gem (nuclear organelle) associated protein 8, partial [Branchiostoma belcheri]